MASQDGTEPSQDLDVSRFCDLLTLTENKSATFSSSSNPCLDFFFQVVPDTSRDKTLDLLQKAWLHDALIALKLVLHLRGVRGTGKSNKEAFYTCTSWLHKHHPQTLVANAPLISKFGYYKDLLEIVLRELQGEARVEEITVAAKAAARRKRAWTPVRRYSSTARTRRRRHGSDHVDKDDKDHPSDYPMDREARIAAALAKDQEESRKAAVLRQDKRKQLDQTATNRYATDASYARLNDAVAEVFARQLKHDKELLDKGTFFDISYAGKWAPSPGRSYAVRTNMHKAIAQRIFTDEAYPELAGLESRTRSDIMEKKLTKDFLVPLRKVLEIPERYMSANQWSILPYERVPSVAMTNYAELFMQHDEARFMKFLENVAVGKKKVAAGALLPHNIVQEAVAKEGKSLGMLAEAQWRRMVNDMKESGTNSKLTSSLAVCDVSGSMYGTPMEVCIALGLLVAELSDEPWKNHVCTFSSDPQLHVIEGKTLAERYKFTKRMKWGMNTDFQKVFRTLLELAQASELPPEKMIQRLFVFSDMEFDQASANPWETDYMKITQMYAEAGYGTPPEIVFWNLRDSRSTPVLSTEKGVALVSGFSKNLLKVFLEDGSLEDVADEVDAAVGAEREDASSAALEKKTIDPVVVMMKAISDELYDELKVVD